MQPTPCHCIHLRRANKAVTDYYDRMLRPCGMTVNQFAALRALARETDASVSDLAAAMGLDRSTLVRTLRPLLEIGVIEDASAAGARNRRLNLTAAGRKALRRGNPLWEKAQRGVEEKLGQEGTACMRSLLDAVRQL